MPSSFLWTATTATSCWIPGHDSLGNISELRGRKMLKGYTYEEAMEKIPNGIGGDMCTVSQSTGLTLYLHYEPVGINNWSVVLGVSEVAGAGRARAAWWRRFR